MTGEVLRGLHHNNAVAYPDYRIKPELAIGVGVINAVHGSAVMDDGKDGVKDQGRSLYPESDEH